MDEWTNTRTNEWTKWTKIDPSLEKDTASVRIVDRPGMPAARRIISPHGSTHSAMGGGGGDDGDDGGDDGDDGLGGGAWSEASLLLFTTASPFRLGSSAAASSPPSEEAAAAGGGFSSSSLVGTSIPAALASCAVNVPVPPPMSTSLEPRSRRPITFVRAFARSTSRRLITSRYNTRCCSIILYVPVHVVVYTVMDLVVRYICTGTRGSYGHGLVVHTVYIYDVVYTVYVHVVYTVRHRW